MAQPEEVRKVMRELKRQWREKNPDKEKEYYRRSKERKAAEKARADEETQA
jgi:hypothetical protein